MLTNLFDSLTKFPSYDPFKPLEETTQIKVENQEYMTLKELSDCFVVLSNNVMKLDENGFLICYHIIMGPYEGLKKSEVELLKREYILV